VNYEVVWTVNAENHLAAIWNDAANRNAITVAAHVIEQELAMHPLDIGDRRTSSVHRVIFRPPLAAEYEVIQDDNRVIVQAVFAS
jgi:hypothetical protein